MGLGRVERIAEFRLSHVTVAAKLRSHDERRAPVELGRRRTTSAVVPVQP